MFGIRRYFERRKFHPVAVKTYTRNRKYVNSGELFATDEVPVTFYENELGERKALATGLDSQPRPDESIALWLAGGSLPKDAIRVHG